MFIDTAKVEIRAGKGGNGAVSFRHEIYVNKGGPDGGNGGKGGDVVFQASRDENTLLSFRYSPLLYAKDGAAGAGQQSAGRSGEDLVVRVPVGTIVLRDGEIVADLVADGQHAVIAHGGGGGFGNAHFKSSTRQSPKFAELGEPGEAFTAELELRLLADVGLVGLPNAGKSTLLSVVSNATPEIADYPFTTITPNLGVATIDNYDLLIADIPGLIEGASEGKGLGDAFLRHVERTSVLLHLVDAYADDAGAAYATIRDELAKHSATLAAKPEIVALTKTEGMDPELVKMQMQSILAANPAAAIYAISASAHQGLDDLLRALKEVVVSSATELAPQPAAEPTLAAKPDESELPVISLPDTAYSAEDKWAIEKLPDRFVVTGDKIERFAIRTNFDNYESVNRLRDILKKLGIRAELGKQGAQADTIIEIAGHEFTLVEQ
jgi:GTP-binding protein